MTVDAMNSITTLHEKMLGEANGLIARGSQLCERVLAAQGDRPDAAIVQLQHDCVMWHEKWDMVQPIYPGVSDVDLAYESSFEEEAG